MSTPSHFLNGQPVATTGTASVAVTSPLDGTSLGSFAPASATEVEAAVSLAARAFRTWSEVPVKDRVQPLFRFKHLAEQRINEIAALVGAKVEESRLAEEVVLMVEKSDIAEELTRLQIHVNEAVKLLDSKPATGKKLDFLAQEILREINTLGQKSRSATIRSVVVELKTEVERIREQVQNVE